MAGRGAGAARGGDQGDGRGHRPGDRRGAGALRGVRALRVHQRDHRPVLPPVRPDDRRLDGHLGLQLADAQPGAGGAAAASRTAPAPRPADRGCSTCCWAGSSALFNWGFDASTTASTRLAVRPAARAAIVPWWSTAACSALTYWGIQPGARRASFRSRTRATSAGNVQLARRAPRLARTDAVQQRALDIALEVPGIADGVNTRRHLGPVAPVQANAPELRLDVRDARAVREARRIIRSNRHAAIQARAQPPDVESPGRRSSSRSLPPPVRGLGTAGGFKLMIEDRGGRGSAALQQAATDDDGRARDADARRLRRPVHAVRAEHAAALPRHRPHQGASRWASTCSDVFNTLQVYLGSLYVNDFNQFGRTWQVNVAGRRRRSASTSPTCSSSRSATAAARWCRSARSPRSATSAARDHGPALQHVPRGGDQRQRRARHQLRARRSRIMQRLAAETLPAGDDLPSGPSSPSCRSAPATRRCSSSCWRWCSCSWCWPRSTKAGRCRWP